MNIKNLRKPFILATLLVGERNHSVASCPKTPPYVNSSIGLIAAVMTNEEGLVRLRRSCNLPGNPGAG